MYVPQLRCAGARESCRALQKMAVAQLTALQKASWTQFQPIGRELKTEIPKWRQFVCHLLSEAVIRAE